MSFRFRMKELKGVITLMYKEKVTKLKIIFAQK